MVGRRQADQLGDLVDAATELQVIARHHPALRVADDRHLRRPGALADRIHERAQFGRRIGHRLGPAIAVVQREDAVTVGDQLLAEQVPADRAIHPGAMDKHHRVGMRGRRRAVGVDARRVDARRYGPQRRERARLRRGGADEGEQAQKKSEDEPQAHSVQNVG